ncbi:hypothetical protein HNQ93_002400 [Hymenobacter luteus]|uniref:Uncharacterized protein n=2 Tax=Hymenobacter TaxID=89966 RepID=A0A7W9WCI6_9BACT|nr:MULTISPECIES: hypothetical protein [Hymenobacter]MBB4602031.1 hypothetical protein [Hymenobacter latericoloratus]MBB6059540.1 hypothetical protein [Hymenobacter luteus]
MPETPTMQVLDIIVMSPKEVFLVGRLEGPMKPGPWELRLNEEVVATLDITGEAQIEAGRKGKLQPPRVAVSRTPVEKSRFDFTRDEVTLVRQG